MCTLIFIINKKNVQTTADRRNKCTDYWIMKNNKNKNFTGAIQIRGKICLIELVHMCQTLKLISIQFISFQIPMINVLYILDMRIAAPVLQAQCITSDYPCFVLSG
jgi:hypothetical protein